MPRAASPAADAANPEPADAAPDSTPAAPAQPVAAQPQATPPPAAEEAGPDHEPEWGNWEFVGDGPMTYPNVPVTVARGDVIQHLGCPAGDGRWQATDADVSKHPDNHRAESGADTPEEG